MACECRVIGTAENGHEFDVPMSEIARQARISYCPRHTEAHVKELEAEIARYVANPCRRPHIPACDLCGQEQLTVGALLFDAPDANNLSLKMHVCQPCYNTIRATP